MDKQKDEAEKQLQKLRRQIDQVDYALLKILQKRWQIIRKIGLLKIKAQMPVFHKARRQHLQKDRIQRGEKMGLSPQFVEKVFQMIQNQSVKEQKKIAKRMGVRKKRGSR